MGFAKNVREERAIFLLYPSYILVPATICLWVTRFPRPNSIDAEYLMPSVLPWASILIRIPKEPRSS